MKPNFKVLIVICTMFLGISGCLDRSLTFQIRYNSISGLQKEDPVYFENNRVGQVTSFFYTEKGDYLVKVAILPEFKNAATVDSLFYIGFSPDNSQKRAVIILQETPGGTTLGKGTIVQGAVKSGFLEDIVRSLSEKTGVAESELQQALQQLRQTLTDTSKQLDSELEKALENLSRKFQIYQDRVQKIPESEEVKKLEESIKQFGSEFNRAQKDVRDHIRNEVLPQLRREMDHLRQQLEKEGRQQEMDEIDRQLEQMTVV